MKQEVEDVENKECEEREEREKADEQKRVALEHAQSVSRAIIFLQFVTPG
jgi:hypothetical protein